MKTVQRTSVIEKADHDHQMQQVDKKHKGQIKEKST